MDWVERVLGVRRYARNGERAPHKPLLLLYALGRYRREGARPIEFSAAEDELNELLREFGPPRETHPGYPFHHLANDGLLWQVRTPEGEGSPGSAPGTLRARRASGRLHPRLAAALDEDPALLPRLVRALLKADFPPSLHADIRRMAGLDLAGRPVREPEAGSARVEPEHIAWHSRQVFRGPARAA